jgi:hypothetical protein
VKEPKRSQSWLDSLNKAVDEGATEEMDMVEVDRKLFGGVLNLIGKVKFHMEPFRTESELRGDSNVKRKVTPCRKARRSQN